MVMVSMVQAEEMTLKFSGDKVDVHPYFTVVTDSVTPVENVRIGKDWVYDVYHVILVKNTWKTVDSIPAKLREFYADHIEFVKNNSLSLYYITDYTPMEYVEEYQTCYDNLTEMVCENSSRMVYEDMYNVSMTKYSGQSFTWHNNTWKYLVVNFKVEGVGKTLTWFNDYVDPTVVTSCGTLSSANTVYLLNQTIQSNNSCLVVGASGVQILCNGSGNIKYANHIIGYGVSTAGYDNIRIEGCEFNQLPTLPPQYATGINGTALDMDGVNDKAQLNGTQTLDGYQNFTVGAWVYVDVYTANMRIFDKSNSYNMMLYSTDELRVTLYNTTTSTTISTSGTNTMVVGRWYYVAFTYNGSLGQIYINGVYKANGSFNNGKQGGVLRDTTTELYVATDGAGANWIDAKIDQLHVYNRTLELPEIVLNNNTFNITNTANLLGFWQFNEGGGEIVYDSSIGQNNGTLSGTNNYMTLSNAIYSNLDGINHTYYNNTIRTYGGTSHGIYLYHYGASATKRDYNISKNSIYVQNTTSYGIYVFGTGLYPSKTVDINGNIINTNYDLESQNNVIGIYLQYVKDSKIRYNNISVNQYGHIGIWVAYTENLSINNNNITSQYSGTSYGAIRISGMNNSQVYDNWIDWAGASTVAGIGGLVLTSSNAERNILNNNFYNNTVRIRAGSAANFVGGAVHFSGATTNSRIVNNTFWDNQFINLGAADTKTCIEYFYTAFYSGFNNTFINNTISGNWLYHVNMSDYNHSLVFINMTGLNQSKIYIRPKRQNNTITVIWYARANVTSSGSPISGATITASTGQSDTTDANGLTEWFETTEFVANDTFTHNGTCISQQNLTCYNYTFTSTMAGYTDKTETFSITSNSYIDLILSVIPSTGGVVMPKDGISIGMMEYTIIPRTMNVKVLKGELVRERIIFSSTDNNVLHFVLTSNLSMNSSEFSIGKGEQHTLFIEVNGLVLGKFLYPIQVDVRSSDGRTKSDKISVYVDVTSEPQNFMSKDYVQEQIIKYVKDLLAKNVNLAVIIGASLVLIIVIVYVGLQQ